MHLTCPSCDSRFLVAIEQLGPAGRRVRCSRCGHAWRAKAARDETPKTDGAPKTIDADPTARLEAFDEARRRSRQAKRPPPSPPPGESRRRGGAAGWVLFAVVALGLVAGAVLYRQQVAAWVPAAADLYALVGLPLEPALQIKDVTSERRTVEGEKTLVVAGRIVNLVERPQAVPPIMAILVDPDGTELNRWTFTAEAQKLPPGGSTTFETSTSAPASESHLSLDFASAKP